ncbi:hypothetical protein G7K_3092-t1 [Saitoella complicata NRRL Y-17804]|uniref:Uncharacterized protein n=1 Tax=Saitoella complicata (strain BCRC 22490 / CBS 7301 / JCM 7358 / NBRC 10748 / NRRL Y-17804) TaxID=698492 RepID=A0A0E9NHQ3_SAICN|nr:hypothetical protein G7K_3092-t1 [Saitoella complicata NRRL Y-17804]
MGDIWVSIRNSLNPHSSNTWRLKGLADCPYPSPYGPRYLADLRAERTSAGVAQTLATFKFPSQVGVKNDCPSFSPSHPVDPYELVKYVHRSSTSHSTLTPSTT